MKHPFSSVNCTVVAISQPHGTFPCWSGKHDPTFLQQIWFHISGTCPYFWFALPQQKRKMQQYFPFLLETYFHKIFCSAGRIFLPRHALFFLTAILEGIRTGSRTSSKRGNNLQFLKRCSRKQSWKKKKKLWARGTEQQPGLGELHWLFVLVISATSEERALLLIIGLYKDRS